MAELTALYGNLLEESGVTQVSPDAKVGLSDRYI